MERKRRISAPFLRAGLNNYRQSKTAVQPESTIIVLIQAEIADNIFSPIIFRFSNFCRKNNCVIILSPFSIVFVEIWIYPVSVGNNGLFAVVTYNNRRNSSEETKCMIINFNPLGGLL